jgi:single-strand DNA-binding protein
MQLITICGRAGSDPKQRFTQSGQEVADVNIACGTKDKTTWYKCSFFGKQAEIVLKYVKKGDPVNVNGGLELEEWTDRNGIKQTTPKINFANVHLVPNKAAAPQAQGNKPDLDAIFANEDEIPF